MEVVRVGKSVDALLEELSSDLSRPDLMWLERYPHPRGNERYRDLVARMFQEFGVAAVLVRLRFGDGEKKYVVVARYDWAGGGVAEGWIIEGTRIRLFDGRPFGVETFASTMERFGDEYWRAEERVLGSKMERAYAEDKGDLPGG